MVGGSSSRESSRRAPTVGAWGRFVHLIGVGIASGILAGLVVGAASRLAMRVVAVAARTPVEFTAEGTLGILVLVLLASIFPGICYALARRFLPGPEAARGLVFGVAMLLRGRAAVPLRRHQPR